MIAELTEQGLPPESIARRLVGELRSSPQIRELILRELLTEEFLGLPRLVERLGDAVSELRSDVNARFDGLESSVNARMDQLEGTVAEFRNETNARMGQLEGTVTEFRSDANARMDRMQGEIRTLQGQMGNVRGESYEAQCARRIRLILIDHLDDVALADLDAIDTILVQARRKGQLTRQQLYDVRVADIIAQGTPDDSDVPILVVIEASLSLNQQDVRNAHRRAGMVQELTGRTTAAFCVAHYRWSDALADTAAGLGVTLIHHELPAFDTPQTVA